ncbi:MAG: hypothetical protein QW115_06095 [Thermoplasmata archaeon]
MLQLFVALLLFSSSCLQTQICSAPAVTTMAGEDIRIYLWIDMYNFTDFRVVGSVEIRTINLHEVNSALPEHYIHADEIRANLSQGLFSANDIERAYLNKVVENLCDYLSGIFGENFTITREWDKASLDAPQSPPADEHPLIYYINYSQKVWLGQGVDEELILGILNDGAVYTRIFKPFPVGYPTTFNLTLPRGAVILDFPFPTNGTWEGRHYYVWKGDREVELRFTGVTRRTYTQSAVNLSVVIDMHTLTNVRGNEYLYTSINISADVHVIAIPDEVKKDLPEGFEMEFIGADGIRLVIAKNVVNLTYIYEALNATVEVGKEKIAVMFNTPVEFHTGSIENITWEGNWHQMDEKPPVHISVCGNATLDFGEYVKKYRRSLSLTYTYSANLLAIAGSTITYTVIFPRNIEVMQVECEAPHEKHYVNGRDAVSVYITNTSETLKILIKINFDIDFERLYPFLVLLGIFIGIWISISIRVYQKKRRSK